MKILSLYIQSGILFLLAHNLYNNIPNTMESVLHRSRPIMLVSDGYNNGIDNMNFIYAIKYILFVIETIPYNILVGEISHLCLWG